MSSKATIVQDTYGAIVVRVDHLDTDSFSRSVDPTATRARKRAVNARTVTHVKGLYAHDSDGRQCVSIIAFATSFAAADALILQHKAAGCTHTSRFGGTTAWCPEHGWVNPDGSPA